MGGRGSGSMSAVRKAKGRAASVRAKSDEQSLEQMGRIMQKTARDHVAYSQGVPGASKFKSDAYASILPRYKKLRSQVEQRRADEAAKASKKKGGASKTFVNSYGEATTRDITAPSYERAQKRQQKAVLRNMGY